ncbi:MAG: PAS domain S-box protein, partial [Proteobacteria bacterium]|nr:PAS domain S-box protein [Pseudomonadota bacterium]
MAEAKILIVEDEAITGGDIQDRLEDFGYDAPAIASSGEGAIKKAEEIKPDLVLMGIMLKGDMDGIEAAGQIRDRFDVPVVYLTAYIDEAKLEKIRVTEPYGYILKPCADMELRTAIEMALQRHKREKALRNAEQDWRNSFNSLEDVMLIIDRDYTIENINEIGLKLLGKSKGNVIGQKGYQVISGADSPGEDCPCMKSLETKKVESIDRYEERFGKYYAIQASPMFDENGEITKFVGLRRDITERKRVEEALRESEELYSMLFNSSNDAVFVHGPTRRDTPGKIVEVNDIACQKFGYTRGELLKLSHLDLVAPEQLEEAKRIEKVISRDPIIFEITAVTKDGKKFPCEISTHQFEFRGQPTVLSILRDIT